MCRALAIAGLAALLAVTGCGSGSKVAPNTVTMVIESSPLSLDPRIGTDAQSEHIDELIFDGLFARAADFTLQPKLATDWSSPSPLDYVIHLRKDVRFHDGRAMTARDVAWTFNSMRDGTVITAKSGAFASVASVTTPDDYTVVIHLKKPDPSVLWNLSDGGFGVVPAGSGKDFAAHPVGTGPFAFVSQKQDDSVDVVRAKISWQPQPSIAGVHFAVVPDATTRALELRKGSADVALNSLTADTIGALKRDTKLRVVATPGTVLAYLAFNLQDPVLRDARVRQAIADGIDREAIIQALMGGYARPAESVLPSNHWAYDQSLPARRYDPAAAMALLDEAGYKAGADGVRLHLNMKTSTDEDTRLLAAVLQQQLRKIGIALDLRSYEFATFYSDVVKGAFQMYSLRWIGGNENPDIFRYVFASASVPPKGANRGRYNNPKVDELIEAANAAPDDAARRVDYVELQQVLATDLPAINLWYRDNVAVMNKRIEGYKASPSGDYSFLETVRISQQQ